MNKEQIAVAIGANVVRVREAQKITQSGLAAILGVKRQGVWKIENGVSIPSILRLRDISVALGVEPAELLQGVW